MATFHLIGRITESGELQIDLPKGLPPGDVQVTLEVPAPEDLPWEERPWTNEELAELLKPGTPKTGAEIVAEIEAGLIGEGWSDMGITSGAEWVEEQRRKHREQNQW